MRLNSNISTISGSYSQRRDLILRRSFTHPLYRGREPGKPLNLSSVVISDIAERADGEPHVPEDKNGKPEKNQELPECHNDEDMGAAAPACNR